VKKILTHKKCIDVFDGENSFLSNFYYAPIIYNGKKYSSTEVAYQAAKASNESDKNKFNSTTTSIEAKKLGRKIKLRDDWELIKDKIMYEICLIKFTTHPELKEKLLATGDAELIEGNYWNDVYWGVCEGIGRNKLGKILMKIRSELREVE
jgi:ribA/ribD-fused uncharacterized protein